MPHRISRGDLLSILLLTMAAVAFHGYHLGSEDQAMYLPAIKKNLDPGLYPHDPAFFMTQAGPLLFDELMAYTVRATRLPLDWALFLWHLVSVFLFLLAARLLSLRCFEDGAAQWAAVTMLVAVLTLPVAGTKLTIFTEYVHPRNLGMPLLLFTVVAVLDRRLVAALFWLGLCALVHAPTAIVGACHLIFQVWGIRAPASSAPAFALLDLSPEQQAWRAVEATRLHHFPLHWKWYELLGAVAPSILLLWFARIGRSRNLPLVEHVCGRLALSGALGVLAGFLFNVVPALQPLLRAQPMRSLHLVYVLLFFFGGGLLGQFVLRNRLRWILLFVPLSLGLCFAQRQIYPASPHMEWPGAPANNAWVQAFDWIRQNTPRDARFALDPHHMQLPGADFHGFRGLAERSMLVDSVKDRSVAAAFPELAPVWLEQMGDTEKWRRFTAADFQRLRAKYGVTWVVLEQPGVAKLECRYENTLVKVCRIE
jgi:hypothetical protein